MAVAAAAVWRSLAAGWTCGSNLVRPMRPLILTARLQPAARGSLNWRPRPGFLWTICTPCPPISGLPVFVTTTKPSALGRPCPWRTRVSKEDRAAAVTGALGLGDGAVMHAGTGSFVALRRHGQLRCVGGWGPTLGDEGSAHWVGREILRAALALSDRLLPASSLGQSVLDRFGGAAGAITFATAAPPGEIAALAPLLLDHKTDPQTQAILQRASGYFADTLTALGWQGEVICPTGGLAPHLGAYLPADMRSDLRPPAADPIEGAILLARRWAMEIDT